MAIKWARAGISTAGMRGFTNEGRRIEKGGPESVYSRFEAMSRAELASCSCRHAKSGLANFAPQKSTGDLKVKKGGPKTALSQFEG